MFIFLIALLSDFTSATCAHSSKSFPTKIHSACKWDSESSECLDVVNELIEVSTGCLLDSGVLTVSQGLTDFIAGFYNGIQIDAAKPSSCVKSFSLVSSTYQSFIGGFDSFKLTPLVESIYTFNNYVNQLSTTYGLCKFSDLYDVFSANITLAISSAAGHIVFDQEDFGNYYSSFKKALNDQNYVSAGISFGDLFSLVTGYTL